MQYRTRAICLRTADYSETSQVVHFLTRAHGLVRLLAKGAKRPRSKSGGAIDLLSEGQVVYSETPEFMAEKAIELAALGVEVIGGCCGTTPAHTRALRRVLREE